MATLENVIVFIRAVELGSFTAAGRSLRLSAAVVSHRVMRLEAQVDCRLFNRTTRKMHLTEQGRIFYDRCVEVKEAWERAEASVADSGAAPRGSLKVTAPLGFGRRVIGPLVTRFREAHPEIDVRLRLSDYLLDLVNEAVDIAVRMAVLPDSSLIVRKVADIERVICAAPTYLERHGAPRSLDNLASHQCLLLRFPGSPQFRWTLTKGRRAVSVPVTGHLDADDGDVLTDWALAGEGLALKPIFEVAAHLKSGALVRVLPAHPPVPATLAVLHAYQRMVPPRVKAFADMVVVDARAHIATAMAGLEPAKGQDRPKRSVGKRQK